MESIIINKFLTVSGVDEFEVGITVEDFEKMAIVNGYELDLYSQDDLSIFYDYKQYEICFYKNRLESIKLKLGVREKIRYTITVGDAFREINSKTRLSELLAILDEAKIKWEFEKITNGKDIYILTEGGTSIIYSFTDYEEELVHIAKVR